MIPYYRIKDREPKVCEHCVLPAAYSRLVTDINERGFNANEPGARVQYLCFVHAEEVRRYLGGRLETLIGVVLS